MCTPASCKKIAGVQIQEDQFGLFTDTTTGQSNSVRRFTWKNSSNISVQVITYGGTITSIKVPDKNGKIEDVVMGFNDMKGKSYNQQKPIFVDFLFIHLVRCATTSQHKSIRGFSTTQHCPYTTHTEHGSYMDYNNLIICPFLFDIQYLLNEFI